MAWLPKRSLIRIAITLSTILLLAILSGCSLPLNLGKKKAPAPPPPSPTAIPSPTATPFQLPPTYTPTPSAAGSASTTSTSASQQTTPTPVANSTAQGTPAPTVAPSPTGLAFAGLCADHPNTKQPCLLSAGITKYHGKRVCRYVFENIPVPDTFFLRINGASMECTHFAQYPTRAYCMGIAPARLPIHLELGWVQGGETVNVPVDQAIVDDIQRRHFFPIGVPPTPTPHR